LLRKPKRRRLVALTIVLSMIFGIPAVMSLRSPQSLPVLASASSLRALEPGTSTTLGLRVNGQERVFLVHIPKGYDGRREVPLVLLYNGITDTPLGFEQYSQS
jgi:hypothetical protein